MTMHALKTRTTVLESNRHARRREKVFGEGRCIPLDRNAKARIMMRARALMHRTEERKHYGVLTAKFVAVLGALVWEFQNCHTGRCFPSYERIADKAGCSRATVYTAIHALERAGILTWVNRIVRVREWGRDLFGRAQNRTRVIRTSNAYTFVGSDPSKSKSLPGTAGQELFSSVARSAPEPNQSSATDPSLEAALMRLGRALQ